jgi:glycosyltransferase involved in cell wall biosynthesis
MCRARPKVTIGLPFYNPGDRFVYALKSIFIQTFEDWELILVNDGSRDGSVEVARSLKDPRIRLFDDNANRGLAVRLNEITQVSRGDILVRMDADDLMHPDRVALLVSKLDSDRSLDLVSSAFVSLDKKLSALGRSSRDGGSRVTDYDFFKNGGIMHPTIAARRAWFEQNPYRPEYVRAEDRELFVRTCRTTRMGFIDRPIYYYFHIGNVRPAAYAASYKTERRVLREYGPERIGHGSTKRLLLRSYMKTLLLYCTAALKIQNAVFRHQPVPLSLSELEDYQSALARIKEVSLPG